MGIVYEAMHRTLGRRVAVKVLHAREAACETQLARFMREGRAAGQVRHPHVVDVFDFGVDDGLPFLVMELVEGETLAQRIARGGALDLAQVAETMLPVISAVAELHAAGIVHRDLKPANILLARDRGETCPKVADFGVSRFMDGTGIGEVTDSQVVLGTYAYMSPEQCRSSRDATERADLYALGAILYECATGTTPFSAPSHYDLLHAIINAPLEAPSERRPGLAAGFDALVLRALARQPGDRFSCAEELGDALLPFAAPNVRARWSAEFHPPSTQSDESGSVTPLASSRSIRVHAPAPSMRFGVLAGAAFAALALAALGTRAHFGLASAGATVAPSPTVAATAPSAAPASLVPAGLPPAPPAAPSPATGASASGPAASPSTGSPPPRPMFPPAGMLLHDRHRLPAVTPPPQGSSSIPPSSSSSPSAGAAPADNGAPIIPL